MKFNLETIEIGNLTVKNVEELDSYIQTIDKTEYFNFLFKCYRQYDRLVIKIKYNENILEKSRPSNADEYLDSISSLYKTAKAVKNLLSNNFSCFKTDIDKTLEYVLSFSKIDIYKFLVNMHNIYNIGNDFGLERFLASKKLNYYRTNLLAYYDRIEAKTEEEYNDDDSLEFEKWKAESEYSPSKLKEDFEKWKIENNIPPFVGTVDPLDVVDYSDIDDVHNEIDKLEAREREIYDNNQGYKLFINHENCNIKGQTKSREETLNNIEKKINQLEEINFDKELDDEDIDYDDFDDDDDFEEAGEEDIEKLRKELKEKQKELVGRLGSIKDEQKLIDRLDFLTFELNYTRNTFADELSQKKINPKFEEDFNKFKEEKKNNGELGA